MKFLMGCRDMVPVCITVSIRFPRNPSPEACQPLIRFLRKESTRETPAGRGLLGRFGAALRKTRNAIAGGIAQIIGTRTTIDGALLEDIEDILLTADVGVEATGRIIGSLESRVSRSEVGDATSLLAALEQDMLEILEPVERPLAIPASVRPYVMLVIGVNGAGKTTTIGKLAARLRSEGAVGDDRGRRYVQGGCDRAGAGMGRTSECAGDRAASGGRTPHR